MRARLRYPFARPLRAAALALSGAALVVWALPSQAAPPQSSERLRHAIEQFLLARTPGSPSEIELPPLEDFILPEVPAEQVQIRLSANRHERFVGSVPVTVSLLSGDSELRRGVVTARIRSWVPVLVAAHALPRGALIRESDLREETRDLGTLPRGYRADGDRLVGRHSTRAVSAGALLREEHTELRPVVSRGQLVRLRFQQGGLRIDGRGKARENGRPGDWIRVQNPSSRREISGRVGEDGTVYVEF